MAKDKVDRLAEVERENATLRAKLAEQEVLREATENEYSSKLQSEMAKIRMTGRSTAGKLFVKGNHDHKNISLWLKDGTRLGPMHPDNAIQLLNNLAEKGVYASATEPTHEQLVAYSQTNEFKKAREREAKSRAVKDKSRKAGQVEKLAEKIAALTGQSVDAMNKILKASEVGKVAA